MARSGQDELELFLDEQPAVRAAKQIQKSYDDLAKQLAATARTFDQNYVAAFGNIQRSSEQTARKIKHDADEATGKIKILSQGFKEFALGSFAGGLSSQAVTSALSQTVQFARDAGQAYIEGARAATFLEVTSKRYALSVDDQRAAVERLRKEYALSQTDAERALAGATRAAALAGRPDQGSALLASTLNLAEAGGVTKDRVPDIIRQIASGQDEAFDALFGVNPSFYYAKVAREQGRTVASLTDVEKTQIRVNTVIREGSQLLDQHAEYVRSAAGNYDKLTAAGANFYRSSGEKIFSRTGINVVLGTLGAASGATGIIQGIGGASLADQLLGPEEGTGSTLERYRKRAQQILDAGKDFYNKLRDAQRQDRVRAQADAEAIGGYGAANRLAREEGPFADIKRAFAAEEDRLRKQFTKEGQLSGVGAALIGKAGEFRDEDIAKRTVEINKQLDAQLADMKAKYSGDQNPLTQLAISGKREMDALIETLKKLGPEFEAQSATIIKEAEKVQNLTFARGLVQGALDISNLQARIDSLTPELAAVAAVGAYGQITDQFTFRESYKKESEAERAARLIRALDEEIARNPGNEDVQRAARQSLLAQTSGISAEALGADPTVRERILRELQAEKDRREADRQEALREKAEQKASRDKQDKAAEKAATFYEGLENSGLTGEEIGKALKAISKMSVGVDLNVTSDREFQAAVADGTALDRVTTG